MAIPGIGPLFLGISNLSLYGILIGTLLLLVYMFTILLALNGDFFEFETYIHLFKVVFDNSEGYYLERNVYLVVFFILVTTITLYALIVYYSYRSSIALNKSLSNSDEEMKRHQVDGKN
ncbi:hypothetical protein FG379_001463 [Cryptosporidium bovis]|uniref:uncharacterized protein n=1 Tax=Cryptosporidium bovis TaxID=310047 RepID=UPI00351A639F|nr:hypothetical protein FG379_001463 [Cryptosporidium bovis]